MSNPSNQKQILVPIQDGIDAMLCSLGTHYAKAHHALDQLRRSLAIRRVWPEAFDNGPVSSWFDGNPHRPESIRWYVRGGVSPVGDIFEKEFPLRQAPEILFNDFIDRHQFSDDPKLDRTLKANVWGYYCRGRNQETTDGRNKPERRTSAADSQLDGERPTDNEPSELSAGPATTPDETGERAGS